MRRTLRCALLVLPVGLCLLVAVAAPPALVQRAEAAPVPQVATSAASILVDADSGVVLEADNARESRLVASTAKIITALVVRRWVPLDDQVPISARAEGMPALKMTLKAGERWSANDLLHSMLLVSANDAAVALAEHAGGGTLEGFEAKAAAEVRALGLADRPVLQDPAGLDDEFSVRGGNHISARDLAIAARALLQDPLLASIVAMPEYRFTGGDGQSHRVIGHNEFMAAYDGAIGVKTGYTKQSGSSLVAAARRNGHTYLVVVIDSTNPVAQASSLLDSAFAGTLKPRDQPDVLPPVQLRTLYAGSGTGPAAGLQTLQVGSPQRSAATGAGPAVALGMLLLAGVLIARRRQVAAVERERRRASGQRA